MPSGMERIPEQRLQKLANIRAMGIDPYPPPLQAHAYCPAGSGITGTSMNNQARLKQKK